MLDIKFIRENPDIVKIAINNKNEKSNIDKLLELDELKRTKQFEYDNLRSEQNKVSKQIGKLKKEKKDASEILSQMKEIANKVKDLSTEISYLGDQLLALILRVPNIPDSDVPIGKDESLNEFYRESGVKKKFTFALKDQTQLLEINKLVDFKRGVKIAGSNFPIFVGKGALLERALINFMLDFHITKHNYSEMKVPFIVNRKTMTGTGQLPKLENDMYHIEQEDLFLIPTAEVPVTNFFADEILLEKDLPYKFTSYTPSFRREAGSYGKDTKGLQRLHQFNKVEMVRFVKPEDSDTALMEMIQEAGDILEALGLHYRVVKLCTGDTSFASAKTYDLEVWAPGTNRYLEVSSVSNFRDFQARRASIRFRDHNGKVQFVHTLNGSGLATPRTFIALIEQYQNEDGSITIPEILRPYLQGLEKISI